MVHFVPVSEPWTQCKWPRPFLEIYRLHGLPSSIVFNRDLRFVGHFWRSLWKLLDTSLDMSSIYYPQTGGQTEVTSKSLGNLLRCLVGTSIKTWDSKLPQPEFAHNHAVNRSSGFSPWTTRLIFSTRSYTFTWRCWNIHGTGDWNTCFGQRKFRSIDG